MDRPDPFREIRLVSLRSLRGANYWSRYPVTRLDLAPGAFDEISSAEVPGVPEALERALPGLVEHRCSAGERGGFLARLRRGTYAPHIVEHVALELQSMIGDDAAYGRARGGDRPGEYTVVFEHLHEAVGLRTAAFALDVVRRAFAGRLDDVEAEVAELRALRGTPDVPEPELRVACAVTGAGDRAAARAEMLRRGLPDEELVVELSPAYLLDAGLPYRSSEVAIVLGAELDDVPERYRDPERARRLVSVVADGVPRGGVVVLPAGDPELLAMVRDARCRPALFSVDGRVDPEEARDAFAVATAREGRIVVERDGVEEDGGEPGPEAPLAAHLAAALALLALTPRFAPTGGEGGGPPPPGARW